MAPIDGADPTTGSSSPLPSRRMLVALTVAGSCLAGAIGGFAAFGVAHALSSDDSTVTASSESPDQAPATQTVEVRVPRQSASLVPSTAPSTSEPTPTTTSTPAPAAGGGASRAGDARETADGDDAEVLPERILPTITSTPDDGRDGPAVQQAGTGGGRDASTTPTSGARDEARDETGTDEEDEPGTDGEREESGASRPTTVPTGDDEDGNARPGRPAPAPDNALLSDRTPLTANRIDGAFRNALAPRVPAERRDELFEDGPASRPLTGRLASLSTGSLPLLHWSVHEPVVVDGDRATARVRSDAFFSQTWREVAFVNVDGEWKLTRESSCQLSRSLLLPCA